MAGLVTSAVVIGAVVVSLVVWLRTATAPPARAAVLGLCSGLLLGLSAGFAKPVINDLRAGIAEAAGDWRTGTNGALTGETLG